MTSTGSPSSFLAQARPPNPAPTITMRLRSAIGDDAKVRMRLAQGGLNRARRVGAREHEAEIAVTLRQRHELLARLDGDHEPVYARHLPRLRLSGDGFQPTVSWDRQHHHARSAPFPVVGRH